MFRALGGMVMSNPLILDSDASAFITAASLTDLNQKIAINKLVISAKANGWWTLCKAIYPFIGGTDSSHKWNLKDPRDDDSAFRLTFNGSWTHDSNGANGSGASNTYANTFFLPDPNFTSADNSHISCYFRTVPTTDTDGYMVDNGGNVKIRYVEYGGSNIQATINNSSSFNISTTLPGYFAMTRDGTGNKLIYKNSSLIDTRAVDSVLDSNIFRTIKLGGGSGGSACSNVVFGLATIGDGISSVQSSMYNDIQAFQTTLGRQV